jgi:hypothetical protein
VCATISFNESVDPCSTGETKTEASDAWLPMPGIVAAALKTRRAQLDGEREAACESWQQMNGIPSLIFTGRTAPHRSPHPQQEARGALRRRGSASVHCSSRPAYMCHAARRPRCASARDHANLRHAEQAVTMEIYANASSAATREALRRLGDILH